MHYSSDRFWENWNQNIDANKVWFPKLRFSIAA